MSSVKNPNFFSAAFRSISATAYYPSNGVEVGGGSRDNIAFAANSQTTFNFPFSIEYTQVNKKAYNGYI
jgi:LEA14-like dessication related protein